MHFQIFVPNAQTAAALETVGLADFIPGAEHLPSNGPEGQTGLLLAWRKPGKNQRMHYNAAEQTWIPALPNGPDGEGKGRYWIGFWHDSPVTPEDLQLRHASYGKSIRLNDGNQWTFPVVQDFTRDLIRNPENGSWQVHVQEQHQAAFFGARKWAEIIRSNEPFGFGELADFVESTLALNYRLTPEVPSHLKLFDTENIVGALSAIISANLEVASE